jgi:hypothetical protein
MYVINKTLTTAQYPKRTIATRKNLNLPIGPSNTKIFEPCSIFFSMFSIN